MAVAGDNTISEPTNYTPFGDTPVDTTTETAEAIQYTDEDTPHLLQGIKNHYKIQSKILSKRLDVGISDLDSGHLGIGTDPTADHLTLSMFNNSLVNHYKQLAAESGLV